MLERATIALGIVALFLVWSQTREIPVGRFMREAIDNGSPKTVFMWLLVGSVAALELVGVFTPFPITASSGGLVVCRVLGSIFFVSGVLLSCWAKLTLGPNWDPEIEDRPLVTEGPYRFLPHPIYFGGFMAALGSQLALTSWLVILAVPGVWVVRKVIQEEELELLEEFGDEYRRYQASTWLGQLFTRFQVHPL